MNVLVTPMLSTAFSRSGEVLQCVAVCCVGFVSVSAGVRVNVVVTPMRNGEVVQSVAVRCSVLQCVAVCCSV